MSASLAWVSQSNSPTPPSPLVDYAAAERRTEPLTFGDYLFGLIASALFVGLLYVPLLLRRVPRRIRDRGLFLVVLLAALLSVMISHAINQPIVDLLSGIAGSQGKR